MELQKIFFFLHVVLSLVHIGITLEVKRPTNNAEYTQSPPEADIKTPVKRLLGEERASERVSPARAEG